MMFEAFIIMVSIVATFTVIGFVVSTLLPSDGQQLQQQPVRNKVIDYNMVHTMDYYNNSRGFRISDQGSQTSEQRENQQ